MKKLSLFIVLTLFIFNSCNSPQETVPEKVKTSFQKRFPKAKDVKWSKEDNDEWEAEFELNQREFSVNFNTEGIWRKTEYDITNSEIPNYVLTTIDSVFSGYEIIKAGVVGNSEMKGFAIELRNDKGSMIVTFNANGKVVEKRSAAIKSTKDNSKKEKD